MPYEFVVTIDNMRIGLHTCVFRHESHPSCYNIITMEFILFLDCTALSDGGSETLLHFTNQCESVPTQLVIVCAFAYYVHE
jgi:hypothetical protein